ncbi:Na+/H+ antiporter subunit E [Ferrimonas futtsuensis]|uniref:Na+/H+ antiporter subunit E n=1 Tax=Ferrimonas futtsuensis TaxID=364764 RepID=UPI00041F9C64|nr:Na+/H+ antiporter subunit E [Ferrimonas futtsuensis]
MSRSLATGEHRDTLSTRRLGAGWRAAAFALLWWMLSDGAMASWWVGVPAVLLATLTSMKLVAPFGVSPMGFARFIPHFIWYSLRGGIDVAWRVFHPQRPIAPALIDFPLRLPSDMARVFMANTVSLLPGTLSAELGSRWLRVHVLDGRKTVIPELLELERIIAQVFGIALPPADGSGGSR